MLFVLHKYFRARAPDRRSEPSAGATMPPSSADSPAAACIHGCCPAPRGAGAKHRRCTPTTTTVRASRYNFAATATSELFPNVHFTNHESLPPLPLAFSAFLSAFPSFADTDEADRIRDRDYPHLCCHVCLDYSGLGLFSRAQRPSPPLFAIAFRPASLPSLLQYGHPASPLEAAMRRRLMASLNVSDEDYTMVCAASTATAFKLLAESYPFHSHKRLLTVYDHESEAVSAISEVALRRGAAEVSSASFSWPGLRINTAKLKRTVCGKAKKRRRGLFVFPLLSRMSGTRYPYLWMSLARDHGWHVLLDACALGAKDMDTLGLSLIQPDFIICSFFKVFGDDPSGFAALFIKKSSCSVLECSTAAQSVGVVGIVPANATPTPSAEFRSDEDSGPLPPTRSSNGEPFELRERELSSEIVEVGNADDTREQGDTMEIECRGLDHADSLGLLLISNRLRYITNWLVIALMKLQHPHSDNGQSLVRIYGPKVKFDRAPAIAFNVFDWKGEKVDPALVQKLADRSNISLSCGFLRNIFFSDKYAEEKNSVLERRSISENKKKEKIEAGIAVVNASLGFMTNFEDAYRLWAFVAKFLDADFVEKERWRYMALNQKMVEV